MMVDDVAVGALAHHGTDDAMQEARIHSSMNIGQAKQVFATYGSDLSADMESLVDLVRINHIDDPLSNSNFLHALVLTDLMFRHATNKFRMVTGCAGDGFLTTLEPSFRKMLSRIKKSKGFARVLFIGGDSTPQLDAIQKEFSGTFEAHRVPSIHHIRHFIVCDDDMVRDEDYHEPLTNESSANQIKARVYFRSKPKASAFAVGFDAMWDSLMPKTKMKNTQKPQPA